jgi:hypothetical protein
MNKGDQKSLKALVLSIESNLIRIINVVEMHDHVLNERLTAFGGFILTKFSLLTIVI